MFGALWCCTIIFALRIQKRTGWQHNVLQEAFCYIFCAYNLGILLSFVVTFIFNLHCIEADAMLLLVMLKVVPTVVRAIMAAAATSEAIRSSSTQK